MTSDWIVYLSIVTGMRFILAEASILVTPRMALFAWLARANTRVAMFAYRLLYCPACFGFWVGVCAWRALPASEPWVAPWAALVSGLISMMANRAIGEPDENEVLAIQGIIRRLGSADHLSGISLVEFHSLDRSVFESEDEHAPQAIPWVPPYGPDTSAFVIIEPHIEALRSDPDGVELLIDALIGLRETTDGDAKTKETTASEDERSGRFRRDDL